ncbi:MAG: rod-binding protein [Planctomycetota bacterium]
MDGASNVLQARAVLDGVTAQRADKLATSVQKDSPKEAGRKFEALFATLLVKEMRSSLSEGFFGQGPQADVYGGWLDQVVGEAMAREGGLHIADTVRQGLERKQAAEAAARARELGVGLPPAATAAGSASDGTNDLGVALQHASSVRTTDSGAQPKANGPVKKDGGA